jgi:small subunit ribosomal protein S4
MNNYINSKIKIIRKLGILPGLTKKNIKKRIKTPGQHGILLLKNKRNLSIKDDYKIRLIEKQKIKYNYLLTEIELKKYYLKTQKFNNNFLLQYIEFRLDCILYRLGYTNSILEARQLINHKHILVNNKIITIPSFNCQIKDIISIKNNTKLYLLIKQNLENQLKNQEILKNNLNKYNLSEYNNFLILPSHLEININSLSGKIISNIQPNEFLININESKVMEYYSY